MRKVIPLARVLATAAHGALDQKRKWAFEPYVTHCEAVANIVASVPHDEGMIAAALCHDVVEDTAVPLGTVRDLLGDDVASLVFWLTNVRRGRNRAERVAIDLERLSRAPPRAATIKVADIIHNAPSIMEHDPSFARIWLPEKRAILTAMKDKADACLQERARSIIRHA